MISCHVYVRSDEKQLVFVLEEHGCFRIAEHAELWELPALDCENAIYAFYPTVFGAQRYGTLELPDRATRDLYPWIDMLGD